MGSSDVPDTPRDGEDDPSEVDAFEDLFEDLQGEDGGSEAGDGSAEGWGWATDGESDTWQDEDESADGDERKEGAAGEEVPSPGETGEKGETGEAGEPTGAPETSETPGLGETPEPLEAEALETETPEATRWWGRGFVPAMGETDRVDLEEKLWSLDHVDISEA